MPCLTWRQNRHGFWLCSLRRVHTIQSGCSEILKKHKPLKSLLKIMNLSSKKCMDVQCDLLFLGAGISWRVYEQQSWIPVIHGYWIKNSRSRISPEREPQVFWNWGSSVLLIPAETKDWVGRSQDGSHQLGPEHAGFIPSQNHRIGFMRSFWENISQTFENCFSVSRNSTMWWFSMV